jgi:hypothetical protein
MLSLLSKLQEANNENKELKTSQNQMNESIIKLEQEKQRLID